MENRVMLNDVIQFSVGCNMSRFSDRVPEEIIYTVDDFNSDRIGNHIEKQIAQSLQHIEKGVLVETGNCVINMMKNQAGIISEVTNGKCLTVNFIKCEINQEKLNPWYFCYLFNESKSIKRQINKLQQGSFTSLSKMNIASIGALTFNWINLDRQKEIGDLYRNALIQEYLMKQKVEQLKTFALEIIERIDLN